MKISVLGQGIGYSLANLFASKGHKTLGIDIRKEALENPKVDIYMKRYISKNKNKIARNISYTTNYDEIAGSDIVFCFVDTPLLPDGRLGIESVKKATDAALKVIGPDCIFVMMSTLPVNGTSQLFREFGNALARRYVYVPPMIQKADFLKNYLKPPYLLFGYDEKKIDQNAVSTLKKFYKSIIKNSPPMWFTTPLNVEITKLGTNAFGVMKGTFFNRLAEYAQDLGADPDLVCSMIASHKVIRKEYSRPGSAIGGPCLPRDIKELYSSVNGGKFSNLLKKIEEYNTPFLRVAE